MRVAVITPYYKETPAVLDRCIKSVQRQTYTAWHHFVVGDGSDPQACVDSEYYGATRQYPHTTFYTLPWTGDSGNTPRLVAFAMANQQGFDAVVFLDADNWMDPEHLDNMVTLEYEERTPIVTCPRRLIRPDTGAVLAAEDTDDSNGKEFNDMNCYFITRPAFFLLHAFLLHPEELGVLSDRHLWNAIVDKYGVYYAARCVQPTINYVTTYTYHYILYQQPAPPNCKTFVAEDDTIRLKPCTIEEFVPAFDFYPSALFRCYD